MTRKRILLLTILISLISAGTAWWVHSPAMSRAPSQASREEPAPYPADKHAARLQKNQERAAYFHSLLRDPRTDQIPASIRARELAFAKQLAPASHAAKTSDGVIWREVGPDNVGGRTRALAIDHTNPDIMIAGGVSGGIWKSMDRGLTWRLKTPNTEVLAVSWVTQDPRPGHDQEWYYSTGEFIGNSAGYPSTAFTGRGVFKSADRGETWNLLPATEDPDHTAFNSPFDFVFRYIINPVTGSHFAACAGYGIYRSPDGGASYNAVLGGTNQHRYVDVVASSDGVLLATLSESAYSTTEMTDHPGVHISFDDGQTWTEITPATYPATHWRSIPAFAPSDPSIAYVMTFTGKTIDGGQNYYNVPDDVRMHKLNIDRDTGAVASTDLTANMPQQHDPDGYFTTQTGYNMILSVKPDDPDFVIMGLTRLYRTRDGFSTPYDYSWLIGNFNSANFHVDQHAAVFAPDDPNTLWIGNDGGIQMTDDIDANTVRWTSGNRGYNVTQFYHASISPNAGDTRVMGGTQDNGSPFMIRGYANSSLGDVSGGDGSFSQFCEDYMYTSSQSGVVLRLGYLFDDELPGVPIPNGADVAYAFPQNASDQLFIHPFLVDPVGEEVMYYPAGRVLWRNAHINQQRGSQSYFLSGWEQMSNMPIPTGNRISCLAVSKQPAHRLYLGRSGNNQMPAVLRLDDAHVAINGVQTFELPNATPGSNVADIAVNPADGDEILVTLSNYNIVGLYHSTDGGHSWQTVEGNLEGQGDLPGPALRSAAILPGDDSVTYWLGTSIGLFSTTTLNGDDTQWIQQAVDQIGNTVTTRVLARESDGVVVAATHGRGIFARAPGEKHTWVLPWISNREGQYESEVAVYNLSAETQTVSLTARRANGDVETVQRTIPAKGFLTENASSLFPDLGSGAGYAVTIEAFTEKMDASWITNNLVSASGRSPSRGVAVYRPDDGTPHDTAGNRLLFSYLPLQDNFVSAPVLVNLDEAPLNIILTFYDAAGQMLNQTSLDAVQPLTPFAAVANELVSAEGDVTMIAESTGLITGASFVFNQVFNEPAIGNVKTLPDQAPDEEFTTYIYPWISNNVGSFESVLVANNWGDVGMEVILTARRGDGTREVTTREIPAHGFLAERASTLFPGLGSGPGYAVEMLAPNTGVNGCWLTNSLQAQSGGSPSLGNAVLLPEGRQTHQQLGDTLLFGTMPTRGSYASAPVIVNCDDEPVQVILDFFDAQGRLLKTDTQTIQQLQAKAPFAALVSELLQTAGSDVMLVARAPGARLTGASFVFDTTYIEPAIGNASALPFVP